MYFHDTFKKTYSQVRYNLNGEWQPKDHSWSERDTKQIYITSSAKCCKLSWAKHSWSGEPWTITNIYEVFTGGWKLSGDNNGGRYCRERLAWMEWTQLDMGNLKVYEVASYFRGG